MLGDVCACCVVHAYTPPNTRSAPAGAHTARIAGGSVSPHTDCAPLHSCWSPSLTQQQGVPAPARRPQRVAGRHQQLLLLPVLLQGLGCRERGRQQAGRGSAGGRAGGGWGRGGWSPAGRWVVCRHARLARRVPGRLNHPLQRCHLQSVRAKRRGRGAGMGAQSALGRQGRQQGGEGGPAPPPTSVTPPPPHRPAAAACKHSPRATHGSTWADLRAAAW